MTITRTVPRLIPADNTDVTDQLNKWIASVPDGKPGAPVDVSFARKQFRCEGTLEMRQRNHLRFRDGGIWASSQGDGHRAHWRAVEGTDLRWLNVKTSGPRPRFHEYNGDLEWQHGFDFQGVHGYDLAACTVAGVCGDGVCNGRSELGAWTEDGTIHATCKFNGTGRQTISFTAARRITVGGVQITDPTLSLFDIEPNGPGWGAEEIVVDGAHVLDTNPAHTFSLLFAQDYPPNGGGGGSVSGVTVKNTVQQGNGVVVVIRPAAGRSYVAITVVGNRTDTPARGYADVHGVTNLVMYGNDIPGSA